MSSLAMTIVFAVSAYLLILISAYNYLGGSSLALELDSVLEASHQRRELSLRSGVRINDTSIYWGTTTDLYLWVENVGSTCVLAREFSLVDVIVVYTTEGGSERIVWLRYDPGLAGDSWRVEDVATGSYNGEAINPLLDLPQPSSGCWDPSESVLIHALVSVEADTTKPVVVAIATPHGSYDVGAG